MVYELMAHVLVACIVMVYNLMDFLGMACLVVADAGMPI